MFVACKYNIAFLAATIWSTYINIVYVPFLIPSRLSTWLACHLPLAYLITVIKTVRVGYIELLYTVLVSNNRWESGSEFQRCTAVRLEPISNLHPPTTNEGMNLVYLACVLGHGGPAVFVLNCYSQQ